MSTANGELDILSPRGGIAMEESKGDKRAFTAGKTSLAGPRNKSMEMHIQSIKGTLSEFI